jgi:hypothetical protein
LSCLRVLRTCNHGHHLWWAFSSAPHCSFWHWRSFSALSCQVEMTGTAIWVPWSMRSARHPKLKYQNQQSNDVWQEPQNAIAQTTPLHDWHTKDGTKRWHLRNESISAKVGIKKGDTATMRAPPQKWHIHKRRYVCKDNASAGTNHKDNSSEWLNHKGDASEW